MAVRVGARHWLGLGALLIALTGGGLVAERHGALVPLRFAIQRQPELMPSSALVDRGIVASGLPVLSLYVRPRDLHDRTVGLLTHPLERGPSWQRPAFVSFFDAGKLLFGAQAGVRIHGQKSRLHSPVQSFRLYFERRYGAPQFRPAVLFGPDADPVRRLVVHNDLRADGTGRYWHFVSPLAYDIARRIGALAPETRPALVFLNGSSQGAYALTEHVSSKGYLQAHFPHATMTVADHAMHQRLRRWAAARARLTMAEVDGVVDVGNLTSWFLSMLFCATTDAFQGPMVRPSTPGSRWFWINWDMDHSFMDLYRRARVPAEHDTFRTLLRRADLRSELVTRLLAEDPAYLDYFRSRFGEMLNHQLSRGFLADRFDHYGRLARAMRVPDTSYLAILDDFLRARPAWLRMLAATHLGGRMYRLELASREHAQYRVDGHPVSGGFDGWYFGDARVRLQVTSDLARFSHWLVDGRPQHPASATLELMPTDDVRVEAVFR